MLSGAIVGAFLVASNSDVSKFGYIAFIISSLSGVYVSIITKVMSFFLLQSIFTIANIVGIYRWFF